MPATATGIVVPFAELSLADLPRVGGKNASLGEMIGALRGAGVRVPDGFAVTTEAFREHLERHELTSFIESSLDVLDVDDTRELSRVAGEIRHRIRDAPLHGELREAVMEAYRALSSQYGEPASDVAVRSSATAEDLPTASFAGQQDTYLFVRGETELDAAVRACMASLFTDRAIAYRCEHGIPHRGVLLSVGVQKMVRSDLACAGVMFTLDTETGFREVVTISGSWGLGEVLVQGRVNPDEFWVHKPTAALGYAAVIRKELGDKRIKLVHDAGGTKPTRQVRVPAAERRRFVLSDAEVLQLAEWGVAVEEHYSARAGRPTPMDLEWAKDGVTGELFVVQARPETVHSQVDRPRLDLYSLRDRGEIVLTGKAVGHRIAAGASRVIHHEAHLHEFRDGEILVAEMTDPDWNPVLKRAAAVVTDQGGRTCHAAIVARELGIPCVVGTGHATDCLHDGQVVTVSCLLRGGRGRQGLRRRSRVRPGGDRSGDVARAARSPDAERRLARDGVPPRAAAERGRGPHADRVPHHRLDRHPPHGPGPARSRR
jgi:pyruvate,water dikinase